MDMPAVLDPECQQVLLSIHDAFMAQDVDEMAVLNEICGQLVSRRFFRLALACLNDAGGLTIKGAAGVDGQRLPGIELEQPHNPFAKCIHTNLPVRLPQGFADMNSGIVGMLPKDTARFPAILYPLTSQKHCIGVLCVVAEGKDGFAQNDHLLLQMAAQHVGFALGMLRALSTRNSADAELRLAAAVFENSLEGIIITDRDGTILAANPAVAKSTGYDVHELIGRNPRIFNSRRQKKDFYSSMWEEITSTGQWKGEIWNRRKDGGNYPEWLSISAIRDERGQVVNYIGIFIDISRQKDVERHLDFLSHHDPLTRLPNRILFTDRLLVAITKAKLNRQSLSVLYIDIDYFKYINDTFGHNEGDNLLLAVAQRLQGCLREEDTLSRMGGDEFAVLLQDLNVEGAELVARKIIEAMEMSFSLGSHKLYVTVSIGASVYPGDGDKPAALLKNSDTAMCRAKSQGRSNLQFFRSNMQEYSIRRVEMEQRLRQALERNEFRVFYQPQIDLVSGRMTGVEALLRWQPQDGSLVPPAHFIPMAEETGLIIPIGEWVLRTACAQCKAWHEAGQGGLRVAVNLSARQFQQAGLHDMVAGVLRDSGLDPACLELELTESIAMQNAAEAAASLRDLKGMGVQISIDDFGTGYSSLGYLKRFPIDKLKIDQSFVAGIAEDTNDAAITMMVITMAHSLGLRVIAEGVETREQLEFLKMYCCNEVQGYLLSPPLPAEEFERLLAASETCSGGAERTIKEHATEVFYEK